MVGQPYLIFKELFCENQSLVYKNYFLVPVQELDLKNYFSFGFPKLTK